MKHKNNIYSTFYNCVIMGLLLIVTALVGCSPSQIDNPMSESAPVEIGSAPMTTTTVVISATPTAELTSTQTVTSKPSPSNTPVATSTATPFPSATSTNTSTPTATWTPLSTIDPQQRGQVYSELMSRNGGCMLPCWWGFELGKTSIDEVRQFYTAFAPFISEQVGRNGISVFTAMFEDPQIENGIQVGHTFIAQNELVIEAEIQVHNQPNYQVESVLSRLGKPAEIWMWTIPEPYEGILPVRFRLYFPEQGVLMVYGIEGMRHNDTVNVCFDASGGTALLLWDPNIWDSDGTKGIIDRANEAGSAFTLEGHPIGEVSNWDVEQFYTILSDSAHTECLETPSNLWSPP